MNNMAFQELLQQFIGSGQCSEAILCTRAGSIVAHSRLSHPSPHPAPHAVASISACLSTAVAKLSFLLGASEVDLILQRGANKSIAICAMPSDMALVTVHGAEEAESTIRQLAENLAQQLLKLYPRSATGPEAMPDAIIAEAQLALDGIFLSAA